MTFRAKPVVRRSGRSGWGGGDRRTTLINAGFVGAIVVAVLILVGYTAWTWYDDHFGVAASVNGQVITRDDLRVRVRVETFRIEYVKRRIQTLMALGRVTPQDGAQQLAFLDQRLQSVVGLSLERLVDSALMARLADEEGVSVGDADVAEQLVKEATLQEQRHVWMIEIEPEVDEDTGQVGDEQRAAARAEGEAALADLRAGTSWEEVARTVSDAPSAPQAGDLGWLTSDAGYDEAFLEAVFAVEAGVPTEVIEGDDTFLIGRVTEIGPAEVDSTFEAQVEEAGISLDDYRAAVRADVVRLKLSEKVVADLSEPGPQRHVLEIFLPEPAASQIGVGPGVKVRHILFSPKDDPDGAEDLPEDDPAWQAAKDEADAAYATLAANPARFDAMARELSDEDAARDTGGKLPWYFATSPIDGAFRDAIFAGGLEPGQVLEPVKSAFGWHVIQFLQPLGEGVTAWAEELKDQIEAGADFARLARDSSESESAEDGGDLGWVAPNELEDELDGPIFATPVGEVSDPVQITGDGVYLFRILAEEVREPTEDQLEIFESTGFAYWYARRKDEADIQYNLGSAA